MNPFDLIIYLVLLLALYNGWRQGFVVQVCSLGALLAGIWLASQYGPQVGAWLGLDEDIAGPGGFAAVLVATILVVAVAARILKKLLRFAGFGVPDIVLGVAVAMAKYLLVLSLLFSAFDALNADHTLASARKVDQSRFYKPVMHLSERLFPSVRRALEKVPPLELALPASEDETN